MVQDAVQDPIDQSNEQLYHTETIPLVQAIEKQPHVFVTGDKDTASTALNATKFVFDLALALESSAGREINKLLTEVEEASPPQTRSQSTTSATANTAKPHNAPLPFTSTPLDSLYTDSMTPDQIWAQIELRNANLVKLLDSIVGRDAGDAGDEEPSSEEDASGEDDEMDIDMGAIEDYDDIDSEEEDDEEDEGEDDDEDGEDGSEDNEDEEVSEETVTSIRPGADELEQAELFPDLDLDRPRSRNSRAALSKRPAHPTLDDAFFSIDDFNRTTEEMESKNRSRGGLSADDEDDEEGEDEDFDLFRAVDIPEAFEEADADNQNENPMYGDFFAPPPRPPPSAKRGKRPFDQPDTSPSNKKAKTVSSGRASVSFNENVRVKTIAARKNKGTSETDEDDDGEDEIDWDMEKFDDVDVEGMGLDDDEDDSDKGEGLEEEEDDDEGGEEKFNEGAETIQRLKNDLFDDDEEEDESTKNLSAYKKRQAELAAQIASLEAENVAKKEWTLMGEANARSRPKNSLLEEDLDFERAAKPTPVVTEEVTKGLEDRIKARILENRFDDVVRKRAIEDEKPFLPSKYFELQDTQSSRSLAQIYEDDYTASREGGDGSLRAPDDRDGKLKKEHEEIDKIWGEICYKLDSLSNAHFTPKQPKAQISTVTNLASTTLESALPTSHSTSTLLAPEEIHAPSTLSSLRARSELTPAEKKAARAKERKTRKKQSEAVGQYINGINSGGKKMPRNVKEAKEASLKGLVKNGKGVTVIGKERKRPLKDGRPGGRDNGGKEGSSVTSGGAFKL